MFEPGSFHASQEVNMEATKSDINDLKLGMCP